MPSRRDVTRHTSVTAYSAQSSVNANEQSRCWIGTLPSVPNRPLIRPTISCTCEVSRWYSGTSVRVGTAICTSSTRSRHSGCSLRNFSNPSSFWGMPLIMSSLSTPSITLRPWNRWRSSLMCACTRSVSSACVNLPGSIPMGNAATRVKLPLSSTPSGVPSNPRMREHALTKWRA